MRNSYHDAIKAAKNQSWTNFLNNAEGKKVFQAYKFTNPRLIEKLPPIRNSQNELKTELNDKCKVFLEAIYPSPPEIQIIEELIPDESIHWPKITEGEIKHAINFFKPRKAPGPDGMSFAILQRAYKIIPEIFNLVYPKLIEKGYHPKMWREGTRIIFRQTELFYSKSIQIYYAVELSRKNSGKNDSRLIILHSRTK